VWSSETQRAGMITLLLVLAEKQNLANQIKIVIIPSGRQQQPQQQQHDHGDDDDLKEVIKEIDKNLSKIAN